MLGLDKLGRALRLWWIWQKWMVKDKPWTGTGMPCNEEVRFLFNASTSILIGNGKKTKFWHHIWLDGEAPRNLCTTPLPTGQEEKQDGAIGI